VDMMETEWARSGAERGMKEETQRPWERYYRWEADRVPGGQKRPANEEVKATAKLEIDDRLMWSEDVGMLKDLCDDEQSWHNVEEAAQKEMS
jgi:hypothetical protein